MSPPAEPGSELLRDAIRRASEAQALTREQMSAAMHAILDGEATPVQTAALAMALRVRGETTDEIVAAAATLRERCKGVTVEVEGPLMDTCGTGGDGAGTFNVSTAAAFVVAGAGVSVAKHGNRAVSSRSGSADLLEAMGARLEVELDVLRTSLQRHRFAFLFAPAHHAALRHAAPVRRELGVRTFFNLLGPLANPARASHQIVGVYDLGRVRQLAEALFELGVERAWVVHGAGGLDEISPAGPTKVASLAEGRVDELTIEPRDFGVPPLPLSVLSGGSSMENATLLRRMLAGERLGLRTVVLMNAAAALLVAGRVADLREGMAVAADSIDSGAARAAAEGYVELTCRI